MEENVNPFELLEADKKEMVMTDIESPAKEMKDSDFPSARRSISMINPHKIKVTDASETADDSQTLVEYRPLTDVYEIESYKEYNRIQYEQMLMATGHYNEGASLKDHAYGILESGKEIVEESCTIF